MINPFVKRSAPTPGNQAKIDNVLANSAHAPGGKYHTPPAAKPTEPKPQMVGATGLTQAKYDGLSPTAQRAINPGAFGEISPEFNNPYTQRMPGGGTATMPTALAGATVGNTGQSDPAVEEYYEGTNPAVNTQDVFKEPSALVQQPQIAQSPQAQPAQPTQVAGDPNDVFRPITTGQTPQPTQVAGDPFRPITTGQTPQVAQNTFNTYYPNWRDNLFDPYATYDPLTQWQQPRV